MLEVSEAYADDEAEATVAEKVHHATAVLLPQMTIKEAVSLFESAESDELAVVDSAESMRVIGTLTEKYALRRYTDELEKHRRELSGE